MLTWIAGPCVIESEEHTLGIAKRVKDVADRWAEGWSRRDAE